MESGSVLLFAATLVFMAPGARGSSHLAFANNSQVNITRTGCGVSKLCVATPADCDPAGNGSCLFSSVAAAPQPPNGVNLSVELRGNSMGYIALGLTVNASQGVTSLFICAQNASNNGTFFFRTMLRNNSNGDLSATETRVTEIRGLASADVIRCEFAVAGVNATGTRTGADSTFSVLLGAGSVSGGTLGPFNVSLSSGPLDLLVPSSNVNTTTAPTGAAIMLQSHALLLLLLPLVGVATVSTSSVCV